MKKLELKHLAPYLPYGMKALCTQDIEGVLYKEINLTERFYSMPTAILTNFKIILRPLSDLNNINNEINLHTINMLIGRNGVYGDIEVELCNGEIIFVTESDPFSTYDRAKEIDLNVFQTVMNELLKGHFDVFGLINQNLAIDINTI